MANMLDCKESSLVRLRGGINSIVYRCGDGPYWVIKGYGAHKQGMHDRMQAEVEFLQYASEVAKPYVPNLVSVDKEQRCVVLEYLEGKSFEEGSAPPQSAISYAVEFFRRLNSDKNKARGFIRQNAAEGFLALSEHIDNIGKRLEAMGYEHLPKSMKPDAKRLIKWLDYEYKVTSEIIGAKIAQRQLEDAIQKEECCVSPSDFGFHNAIRTKMGIRFIDFEFSGWDDPAKAALDFILQPRIPVLRHESLLFAAIERSNRHDFSERCKALKAILLLKWSCIILSILNPDRLDRVTRNTNINADEYVKMRINTAYDHIKRHAKMDWSLN